ncbi:MAG TPA: alpha-N-arabinofuranosidase, partial [Bacteroidales bacterium]|nr:alpha-N-arabinofuranosidase [Bacteroidales bacterium]
TLVNADLNNEQKIDTQLLGAKAKKVNGQILTTDKIDDHNSFDNPAKVKVKDFNGASLSNGNLSITLPPSSVVMLELQ